MMVEIKDPRERQTAFGQELSLKNKALQSEIGVTENTWVVRHMTYDDFVDEQIDMALEAHEVKSIEEIPFEELRDRLTRMRVDANQLVSDKTFLSVIDYRVPKTLYDPEDESYGGFSENVLEIVDMYRADYDETSIKPFGVPDGLETYFIGSLRLIVTFKN